MAMLPLQATGDSAYCVSGNVTIHPSAAIAPTAILQANPGSHLIIGADVCIGRGAVLHADGGVLTVEAGASLGATVLLVGSGIVGANACIGSATTVINPQVAAGAAIAPQSLLGDTSRKIQSLPEDAMVMETNTPEPPSEHPDTVLPAAGFEGTSGKGTSGKGSSGEVRPNVSDPATPPALQSEGVSPVASQPDPTNGFQPNRVIPPPPVSSWNSNGSAAMPLSPSPLPNPASANSAFSTPPPSPEGRGTDAGGAIAARSSRGGPVYGKEAVERLMSALFPHRQALSPEQPPPPEQPNTFVDPSGK